MKKLFVVLLSVLCLLSLCACSSSEKGNEENQSTEVKAFKLGGSGPTTGDYAEYGMAVKNAAQLAVDEINALGGDIQFELNFQDDQGDPDQAETAFGTMMDWGMQLSLETTTSGAGIRVAPLYAENQIFAMTPSGSNPLVTLKDANDPSNYYGNIFQMCFTDPNQGVASADYISMNSLGSKAAVIYENDIDYSTSIYNTFMQRASEVGLDVVYEGTFIDSDKDFSVQLTAAQNAGADVVFLPIYYSHATYILNQAKAMNYAPIFFGVDGMDGILAQEGFDASIAEGVYLLTPFSATASDEKVQHFVQAYKDNFGSTPNQFGADAYDAVYAIYECIKNGNITADMSNADICAAIVDQILNLKFVGVTGQSEWEANGQVTKVPMAVVIHDGAYVDAQ